MHSLGVCLPQSPVIQVLTSLAKSYQLSQKPHKLLETITFTVILNRQARSTELTEKLDSSGTEVNYMALKELSKSWLKAQHSENDDHGIWSHHFMGNRWGNSGNSVRLLFWGAPKSLQMVTAAMKLKDTYSLEEKL